jgi:hypothetical protein
MSSDIFRDRTEGANARRLDLLRRRRDELITMPHAVRRVFVTRSARIAAGLAACVGGLLMLLAAALPPVYRFFEGVLPGFNPAALSQLLLGTWLVAVITYALARSRSEHRFIVAMSKCVLPGEDLDHDIERLSHEHPDAIAKTMAQRLEVRSAALPVIAAAFLLPATAVYVIDAVREGGWPKQYEYHLAALGAWIAAFGALGIACGIVMTRRWARVPQAATIAGALACALAIGVPVAAVQLGTAPLWLIAPALVATAIAIVVRRLRVERALIDAVDPAAGSELFSLRRTLATLRATVPPRAIAGVLSFCGLLLVGGDAVSVEPSPARGAKLTIATAPSVVAEITPAQPAVRLELPRHAARADVAIYGGTFSEIRGIAGLEQLPEGWKLTATVRLVEPAPGHVRVRALGFGSAKHELDPETGTMVSTVEITACGASAPVGLRVEPEGTWTRQIALSIVPQLVYAPCTP